MEYQKLFFLTILTIFFIHVWWCKMQEWSPTQLQSKFHLITAKLNYFLIARFKLGISELQGGSTLSTDSLGKQSFTFFRYSMFSYIQILMLLQSKSDNSKMSTRTWDLWIMRPIQQGNLTFSGIPWLDKPTVSPQVLELLEICNANVVAIQVR